MNRVLEAVRDFLYGYDGTPPLTYPEDAVVVLVSEVHERFQKGEQVRVFVIAGYPADVVGDAYPTVTESEFELDGEGGQPTYYITLTTSGDGVHPLMPSEEMIVRFEEPKS